MTMMITTKTDTVIILDDVKEFCIGDTTTYRVSAYEDDIIGTGTLFEEMNEDGTL